MMPVLVSATRGFAEILSYSSSVTLSTASDNMGDDAFIISSAASMTKNNVENTMTNSTVVKNTAARAG